MDKAKIAKFAISVTTICLVVEAVNIIIKRKRQGDDEVSFEIDNDFDWDEVESEDS